MQAQLDGMASGINQSLSSTVAVINGDAQALARLNDQIVNAQSRYGGQPPNDLLDQRHALVQKIASNIGISPAKQDDGSLNVITAKGERKRDGKGKSMAESVDLGGRRINYKKTSTGGVN